MARLDIIYRLRQMVAYLKSRGVAPVFTGYAPMSQKSPYVIINAATGEYGNDDLMDTDGSETDWGLTVYGDSFEQIDALVVKLNNALNRPGEYIAIGADTACYCRVTGDGFEYTLEEGGEKPLVVYNLTCKVKIMKD